MTPRMLSRVLAVATLLTLTAEATFAATINIQPSSQDAYVTRSQPNAVHGSASTATRMFVMSSNPNPRWERALVQFDLPIPAFSTITAATLQINQQSAVTNSRTHGAHRVTSAWLQSSVKWFTMPAFNASPTDTATVGTARGFKNFVVTADVQAMVNDASTNHGWLILDENELVGNDEVGYVTREEANNNDIAKKPILTIDFTAPACTTNADCQDTNPCTSNERCQAGHCAVDPTTCDDGNACTDDICDPQQGCLHPVGECNDGFSCTTDTCDPQGGCVHTPVPSVCLHNGCQTGTCVADQNNNTIDPVTGCQVASVAPDNTACNSDGIACTSDLCAAGECTHPNASVGTPCGSDGNPCTDDVCDGAGACGVNNTAPCNDGNGCTQTDQCAGGTCLGSNPVVCAPADACHLAGVCNQQTGLCSSPQVPTGTPCDDGSACTQLDQCDGSGQCVGSNSVVCTASDQCHDVGTCSPGTGVCSNPPKSAGMPCTDGDACTQTDQCNGAGQCVGGNAVVCAPPDQCHDPGSCNPGTGVCSNPPKASGSTCDDGSSCTQTDQCNGSGSCVGGNPVICTALDQCHDVGTCSPGTGLCSNPAKTSGSTCNDGNACTQTDQCDGGGQCVGTNPVVCTAADVCHVAGTCDPQTGVCSTPNAPEGTTCSDGNTCTLNDACTGGLCLGNPMTCGDSIVQPSCNEQCDDPSPGANCTAQCQFICGPTPQTGCRKPVLVQKGLLVVKNKSPDKRDGLVWKWVKGAATVATDFGTPLTSTGYTICVYDGSANPQPLLLAMAPPGGTCHGKPCWQTTKTGFKYKDKDLTPDGLSFVLEKAGAAKIAKLIVKGKGAALGVPPLPLTPTVTVQLKRNDNPGVCWDATYSTPIKNLPDQFKSHAD